jgi:choline dehydrogenase-like flavoprotein
MGDDPARSVVDRNLRAHDVPNLHLCTTGVWTTGGCANPTLTLSALALRLADHLSGG